MVTSTIKKISPGTWITIAVMMLSVASAYGTFTVRMSNIEEDVRANKVAIESMRDASAKQDVQLSRIEATLSAMKDSLDRLNRTVERITP